jgi:hypothetical protein
MITFRIQLSFSTFYGLHFSTSQWSYYFLLAGHPEWASWNSPAPTSWGTFYYRSFQHFCREQITILMTGLRNDSVCWCKNTWIQTIGRATSTPNLRQLRKCGRVGERAICFLLSLSSELYLLLSSPHLTQAVKPLVAIVTEFSLENNSWDRIKN